MPHFKKSLSELEDELREQLLALRARSDSYDNGNHWEAKHLATIAHVLLHSNVRGPTVSLLAQLGIRTSIKWISSISEPVSARDPRRWRASHGLIHIVMKNNLAEFAPKLEKGPGPYRELNFEDWYEEVIFRGLHVGSKVTRKNLIHFLNAQDGGKHVDAQITNEYYYSWKMLGDPIMRYEEHPNGPILWGPFIDVRTGEVKTENLNGKPILNSVRAAMRQIGWEIAISLSRAGH